MTTDGEPVKYIHVRNLERYNPGYKDRELTWIKVYFKMLTDPDFVVLEEIDKWRLMMFILTESQHCRPVKLCEKWLEKFFGMRQRPIALTLKALQHFIEYVTADFVEGSDDVPTKTRTREEFVDKTKRGSTSRRTGKRDATAAKAWLQFVDAIRPDLAGPQNKPWTKSEHTTFSRIFDRYYYSANWPAVASMLANMAKNAKAKGKDPKKYFVAEERRQRPDLERLAATQPRQEARS